MLSKQRKKFVLAMLAGANQTQAAIAAGYAKKNAANRGSVLMKDAEVKAAIEQKCLPPEPEPVRITGQFDDPLDFLKAVMNTPKLDLDIRKDAAKSLMPYIHAKKGEHGKKALNKASAMKVASRFGLVSPPPIAKTNH